MYRVYDKNAKPGDLAIEDFFTVEAAEAKIAQLEKQGCFADYKTFTPQCTWGRHRDGPPCQNEATWFIPGSASWLARCDEHSKPEVNPMARARREEMERIEREGPSADSSAQSIANFWFQDR